MSNFADLHRPYNHYECLDCGNICKPEEIKPGELCPKCGEQCELKHDCPRCMREMDADYDKGTWTCDHCKITIPLEEVT
jgi:DNA-directed RNA polymerase subunit RPC12/RpoP